MLGYTPPGSMLGYTPPWVCAPGTTLGMCTRYHPGYVGGYTPPGYVGRLYTTWVCTTLYTPGYTSILPLTDVHLMLPLAAARRREAWSWAQSGGKTWVRDIPDIPELRV